MAKSGLSILDPMEMWREALAQWEGSANKIAGKQLGSEDFTKVMHSVTGATLGVQQALTKANKAMLKELNLPSRADFIEMGERLQRIEDMLEHLIRQLGAPSASATVAQAMPPRTRKPPTAAAPAEAAAAPAAVAPVPPAAAQPEAKAPPLAVRKPAASRKAAAKAPPARKAAPRKKKA